MASAAWLPAIIFVVVFGIVVGLYAVFILWPERRARQQIEERLRGSALQKATLVTVTAETKRLSAVPFVNAILARQQALVAPLRMLVERSGLKITVGTLVLAMAASAALAFLLLNSLFHSVITSLVGAGLAAWVPHVIVSIVAQRRTDKFEEYFPEALDLIVRALRAGHAFTTGLSMVADEMPEPVKTEFRLLYDRQNFGAPLDEAMRVFAERVPLLDAKFFVTAVLTQREAGGNLSEVLENLAAVIRERFTVRRTVRAKSAHGRMTGWVLAAVPPVMALGFAATTPDMMKPMITDPLGIRMLQIGVALQVVGTLIIRRLVRIEY